MQKGSREGHPIGKEPDDAAKKAKRGSMLYKYRYLVFAFVVTAVLGIIGIGVLLMAEVGNTVSEIARMFGG